MMSRLHGQRLHSWKAAINGLSLPYNSGAVEGTVNRLNTSNDKCLSARFDLVRKRVLAQTQGRQSLSVARHGLCARSRISRPRTDVSVAGSLKAAGSSGRTPRRAALADRRAQHRCPPSRTSGERERIGAIERGVNLGHGGSCVQRCDAHHHVVRHCRIELQYSARRTAAHTRPSIVTASNSPPMPASRRERRRRSPRATVFRRQVRPGGKHVQRDGAVAPSRDTAWTGRSQPGQVTSAIRA